ncbi:MAG: type IV secretion system protein [Spirochaetaceae bacterium]|jgi:type IV secretion system protein VirB5|nr:type IV secretion system protein [Spirochaetaceae bacterium]
MASLHKNTTYKPLAVNNPFDAQDKMYGDLLAVAEKDKKKWRTISYILLLFVAASICGLFYAVNLQKTVPVLVNVMPHGEAQYLGEVRQSGEIAIPEAAIQFQIRMFLTYLRTIPFDADILFRDITKCYDMVSSICERKMTAELRAASPFPLVGSTKRAIQIETILKLTNGSYQVDWIENTTAQGASTPNKVRMRGIFTIKLLTPTEKNIQTNPLGIYVDNYDMTRL